MPGIVINDDSMVCAAKHLAAATAPDERETVIVDPVSGRYYGLDAYAVRVWALVQQPRRVGELLDTLLLEYEVERDVLLEDMTALLRELAEAGLVEITLET